VAGMFFDEAGVFFDENRAPRGPAAKGQKSFQSEVLLKRSHHFGKGKQNLFGKVFPTGPLQTCPEYCSYCFCLGPPYRTFVLLAFAREVPIHTNKNKSILQTVQPQTRKPILWESLSDRPPPDVSRILVLFVFVGPP
jgi:hypothetical protein